MILEPWQVSAADLYQHLLVFYSQIRQASEGTTGFMEPLQGQITTASAGVTWLTQGLCHRDGGGGNNGGGGGVSKQHGLNFFLGSSGSISVVGEQEEHVNKQAA